MIFNSSFFRTGTYKDIMCTLRDQIWFHNDSIAPKRPLMSAFYDVCKKNMVRGRPTSLNKMCAFSVG